MNVNADMLKKAGMMGGMASIARKLPNVADKKSVLNKKLRDALKGAAKGAVKGAVVGGAAGVAKRIIDTRMKDGAAMSPDVRKIFKNYYSK